jgi:protein Mpv17
MFPTNGPRALSLARKLWLHKSPRQQRRNASSSSTSSQNAKWGGLGPLLSSAATCGAFSLLSDTLVQNIELKNAKDRAARGLSSRDEAMYDPARAGRMLGFGLLFYGPFQHFWYAMLDKQFNRKTYLPHFASKVALNQVVLGPIVVMGVFTWNLMFQRKLDQLGDKVKRDFVPSMLTAWKFWVPAASVNFWLIPLRKQVVFMSACSIAWTGYLSYASNSKPLKKVAP